jgi:predicted CoA-binding protein
MHVLREPHLGLRMMLESTPTLTVLGAGLNDQKPAHRLFHDLAGRGWNLVPVHPRDNGHILTHQIQSSFDLDSTEILVFFLSPQQTFDQLKDIHDHIGSGHFPFVWLQPGAADEDVLAWLNEHNIPHVVDECVVQFILRHHVIYAT